MDETQISITVKPIYIERLIYWIIILALAVTLIVVWVKSPAGCTVDTAKAPGQAQLQQPTTQQPAAQQAQSASSSSAAAPEAPKASCTDATKNGDETDIDCGGSCTLKCASGSKCRVNSDCVSNICTAGVCTNIPSSTLSGKLDFKLDNVAIQTSVAKRSDNTTYNRVKVTGVSYKITNGLSTDLDGMVLKVFVKNRANTYCLNQQTSGTCDDAYATFSVGRLAMGKSLDEEHTFSADEYTTKMGKYVADGNGYEAADVTRDEFNVIVFVYDSNGELINSKTVSDAYIVNP
jgi:hypothetical protein